VTSPGHDDEDFDDDDDDDDFDDEVDGEEADGLGDDGFFERFGDDDVDGDRAPICRNCGVTALPAHLSNVIDSSFVCDNEDCDAYGQPV